MNEESRTGLYIICILIGAALGIVITSVYLGNHYTDYVDELMEIRETENQVLERSCELRIEQAGYVGQLEMYNKLKQEGKLR